MRIPEDSPPPVRRALAELNLTETGDTFKEDENVVREAALFVERFFPAGRRPWIASARTADAASCYMPVQGTGVIVFDAEEADVVSWLGTMFCRPEREIFLYVQLLIAAAQMEIGRGRVDNALTLAQWAHYQLFRFAQVCSGDFRPATREGLASAVLISKLIPRFVCGHEIGHHWFADRFADRKRDARDIEALRDLYTERDDERVVGSPVALSRTTKPDTEYDINADGRCTAVRVAAIDRFPNPKKWDGYFPEIAADFVGMLFVTEFASLTSVPPSKLLEHLSVVFHVMEMRRQIRTLVGTTPTKSFGGGTATFPYSGLAYRVSMLAVIAKAIADNRLDGTPLAKNYWGRGRRDVDRFVDARQTTDIDIASIEALDAICRRGLLEGVGPPGSRPQVDQQRTEAHPLLKAVIDWIEAPMTVAQNKFRIESTYHWVDRPEFEAWSGWACATMDIARMVWDPDALLMSAGVDYLKKCAGMSKRDLFDIVSMPRWDIVDGAVTFPPQIH